MTPTPARAVLGLALTVALAACSPGGSPDATTSASAGAASTVSKDLGTSKISLSVVTTPESGAPLQAIIAKFEAQHPNVDVEVAKTTFDDYNKALALALASDSSPDIALLNMMGNSAKNRLVIPLDDYAKLYGWDSSIPTSLASQWKVGADLLSLGGDRLYAVPTSGSEVGLFYNKDLLAKAGIANPPATVEDLTAALEKAKAAGLLPLQLGNAQGHASFLVQGVAQGIDGADASNTWALGQSGATFDTPGNKAGAQLLLDYATKGYIPADANAVDLQGAVTKFGKGEGVFLNDGNWDAGTIQKALGDKVGFAVFPGPKATAIGGSIAYAISTKSKNPNAAAAFLDFLRSDEAAQPQFDAGFLPANTKAVTPTPGLQSDLLEAYGKINADNGIVSFNNNATASMNDTLVAQTQALIARKTSVEDFIAAIQADWAGSHK